jgi:RNA polymerase sigma factor (sigma-70 family)
VSIIDRRNDDVTELYSTQRAPMTRLAFVITGSQLSAQDVVHDAFIRFARASSSREIREPVAYLRTVVVNTARTAARRAARPLPQPEPAAVTGEPEVDELWAVVQRLPEKYRTALALRFYADLGEQEMAEHLGCRPGTVKSLVHRGLELLRKELER